MVLRYSQPQELTENHKMELKATEITRAGYRVSEVVKMTGISRTAAYDLIKTGKIPSVKLGEVIVIPAWWVDQQFEKPTIHAA